MGSRSNNYKLSSVSATTTQGALVAKNANRSALIFHNQSTTVDALIYLNADTTDYITLKAEDTIHFPEAPINAMEVKTASGTAKITIWEA